MDLNMVSDNDRGPAPYVRPVPVPSAVTKMKRVNMTMTNRLTFVVAAMSSPSITITWCDRKSRCEMVCQSRTFLTWDAISTD